MDRARPGSGETDADFAGEFGVRASHEGGHFFVPHLHVIDLVARAIDRADDAVNAVAGEAEDAFQPPFVDPFDEKIADRFTHVNFVAAVCDRRTF